jgi:hypothetical protein
MGFGVLRTVTMKMSFFRDVIPCSLVESCHRQIYIRDSRSSDCEHYCLLCCDALQCGRQVPTFQKHVQISRLIYWSSWKSSSGSRYLRSSEVTSWITSVNSSYLSAEHLDQYSQPLTSLSCKHQKVVLFCSLFGDNESVNSRRKSGPTHFTKQGHLLASKSLFSNEQSVSFDMSPPLLHKLLYLYLLPSFCSYSFLRLFLCLFNSHFFPFLPPSPLCQSVPGRKNSN